MNQAIANGLIAGSSYALFALGFTLIFSVSRFFHFTHAAVFTTGAYVTYWLTKSLHWPLPAAIALGILAGSAAGSALELTLYRHLRRSKCTPLGMMLASLGAMIAIQNLVSLLFGDAPRVLRQWPVNPGMLIFGARVTVVQLTSFGTAIGLTLGLLLISRGTRLGRWLRAVAQDPELARVYGVPTGWVFVIAFAVGSGLGGIAGIVSALEGDLVPGGGFQALLPGFAAAVAGGIGNPVGAFLGGLLVGLTQHLSGLVLPTQWQEVTVFLVLAIFLVVNPMGHTSGNRIS